MGELVLELLPGPEWLDSRTASAVVKAAALIRGDSALGVIARFRADTRLAVAAELAAAWASFDDDGQWITHQTPPASTVIDRPARTRCQGAPELASTRRDAPPAQGHERIPTDVLASRLTTVAHPLHATALTIHAVTGAGIGQLALIRGIDIDETATAVKVHNSTAHRRCRLYPLPTWTRPLITIRHGQQLHLSAAGIRYALDPTR
ncbi:hypothetical protein ABZV67_43425 [Streptomyces sp. NPDC005065]|uniref:hypothetical protein n=1 Tax=Streptomyces sp. NPDC005065 TaxID=3154461 RepID=UPI0033BC4F97